MCICYVPLVTAEVSNSDQLFVPDGAIMDDRDEHFFSLFQVSELSQPI